MQLYRCGHQGCTPVERGKICRGAQPAECGFPPYKDRVHHIPFRSGRSVGDMDNICRSSDTQGEEALVYGISKGGKSLLYLNDTGSLSDDCFCFLAKNEFQADFVSMDCTHADNPEPHSERHMGFVENELMREKLHQYHVVSEDAKYYVTHFSHNSAPFRARMEEEAARRGFIAAHDGLEIEI